MLFAEMQAYLPGELVVNCTGYWSRELFDDSSFKAVRGHLVRAEDTAMPMEEDDIKDYFDLEGDKHVASIADEMKVGEIHRDVINIFEAMFPSTEAD